MKIQNKNKWKLIEKDNAYRFAENNKCFMKPSKIPCKITIFTYKKKRFSKCELCKQNFILQHFNPGGMPSYIAVEFKESPHKKKSEPSLPRKNK